MSGRISRPRAAGTFVGAFVSVALAGAPPARAIQEWGDQIPNLTAAGGCDGLCHPDGTSSPLYLDLEAAGFVWNTTMANDDSDGDGFSNGWEVQNPAGNGRPGKCRPGLESDATRRLSAAAGGERAHGDRPQRSGRAERFGGLRDPERRRGAVRLLDHTE
jgi:hypothetical protein